MFKYSNKSPVRDGTAPGQMVVVVVARVRAVSSSAGVVVRVRPSACTTATTTYSDAGGDDGRSSGMVRLCVPSKRPDDDGAVGSFCCYAQSIQRPEARYCATPLRQAASVVAAVDSGRSTLVYRHGVKERRGCAAGEPSDVEYREHEQ